jgi:SagB-type dehydrogenase family enzyme
VDDDAALDFYRRTKLSATDAGFGDELLTAETTRGTPLRFALPRVPVSPWPSLEQSIVYRRTSRSFDPAAALSCESLARLLTFSCGSTTPMESMHPASGYRRAAPSAGARYPLEMHLAVLRVAGIPAGIYVYDALRHHVVMTRSGFYGHHIARWSLDQPWMANSAVVFALVATPGRTTDRYQARGYRYVFLEAGHIAQNLYLLGAAAHLCVQATGGFFDDALGRLFGIDENHQQVLYLLAVGPADPNRGLAPW